MAGERASGLFLRQKAREVDPPTGGILRQELPGDPDGEIRKPAQDVSEPFELFAPAMRDARHSIAFRPIGDVLVVDRSGLALLEQKPAVLRRKNERRLPE